MKKVPTLVVALGGNALLRRGDRPTLDSQIANVQRAAETVGELARDHQVVVTHGNGPQVGALLLRSELAASRAYPVTLDVAVAESEGEIGYLLQQAIQNASGRRAVSLVTQVVVSIGDPAFRMPTKPIGPEPQRRLVPSPRPIEIVEAEAVRILLRNGLIVIAAGGGGIPVARSSDGLLEGVDAVVDKDHASALLADLVEASSLSMLTDVDGVYLDFGTAKARKLDGLSLDEARRHLDEGQFPAGSMGPKVEAAIEFVARDPAREAHIGSLDDLGHATRISAVEP